ncbi:hypothetical protein M0R45_036155 [Rubus argutus]|uniref:Uncharacterized protein n=1 Tax=Rubus argutus TaxID=59490 RepID=A0AAW1VWR7_RUBAR
MDSLSRGKSESIRGYWRAWEIWACEYLVVFHPWGNDESEVPYYVKRVLFQGPARYAWYLGERVSIQSLGTIKHRVPTLPPRTMLPDYRLRPEDIKVGMVGWEASEFRLDKDKDYESYRKKYLVYRHQPSGDATDEMQVLLCTTNTPNNEGAETYNPVKLTTIAMSSRSMILVGWESGQCEIIEVLKGQKTPLLTLASNVKYVGAEQESELLDIIAGQISLIFKLCMDGHKDIRLVVFSRINIRNVHKKRTGNHHKATLFGDDFYFYESDDDDNITKRMYTDDDGGDNEVDVEENVEKEICCSEYATTITKISDKDSQVINALDVDIEKGGKRGRKPSTRAAIMKATQPSTKRTRRVS